MCFKSSVLGVGDATLLFLPLSLLHGVLSLSFEKRKLDLGKEEGRVGVTYLSKSYLKS